MNKKLYNTLIGLVIIVNGFLFAALIYSRISRPDLVTAVHRIDTLTFQESKLGLADRGQGASITTQGTDGKDYGSILPITTSLILKPFNSVEGYSFHNGSSVKDVFELQKELNDDTSIRLVFDKASSTLSFIIGGKVFKIGNTTVQEQKIAVASIGGLTTDGVIEIGSTKIVLDGYANDRLMPLGELRDAKYRVFSRTGENLLAKGGSDFRLGTWSSKVMDCSKSMAGEANISSAIKKVQNAYFLELSSKNHQACTSKQFTSNFVTGKKYILSFDYKTTIGRSAKYYYQLKSKNTKENFSKTETIATLDDAMHSYKTLIEPKNDFMAIEVYLYAPFNGTEPTSNLYGNVSLYEYAESSSGKIVSTFGSQLTLAQLLAVDVGEVNFASNADKRNIIESKEASFEGTTWLDSVQDCCQEKPGMAKIGMELSSQCTDGSNAISLSSSGHCACVNKMFSAPVKNDTLYKLSFDYKSETKSSIQSYYALGSKSGNAVSKNVRIAPTTRDWNTYSDVMNIGNKAVDSLAVYFYASSDRGELVKNSYDNLRLEEYYPKDVALYRLESKRAITDSAQIETIEFSKPNRWQNYVVIEHASVPFLLNIKSVYDAKVKVSVTDLEGESGAIHATKVSSSRNDDIRTTPFYKTYSLPAIAEELHYKMDDGTNAWYFDVNDLCIESKKCVRLSDGTYRVKILIQKEMYRYFVFSIFVVLGVDALLAIWFLQKKIRSTFSV